MDSSAGEREKLIQGLIQGHESAKQLRLILGQPFGDDKSLVTADDLVTKILQSFTQTISILTSHPIEEDFGKIPAEYSSHGRKSKDSEESSKSTSALKEWRGKRSKTTQTWTCITPNLVPDGHAWRKYGQKVILNAKHPRKYYRCTHKVDQGCEATKQVQSTEEDPPMYRTTYQGNHTCQNLLTPDQMILDSSFPKESNSVLLSFGSSSDPYTKLNHEPCYPTFPLEIQDFSHNQKLKPSLNPNQSTSRDRLFPLSNLTSFDSFGSMPVSSPHSDVFTSPGMYSYTTNTHGENDHSFDHLDMMVDGGDGHTLNHLDVMADVGDDHSFDHLNMMVDFDGFDDVLQFDIDLV